MKVIYAFYLFQLLLTVPDAIAADDFRQAIFSIASSSVYIPFSAIGFLANVTSNSMNSFTACAQRCISHASCQTATFYKERKTCSLFSEKSNVGQISVIGNQASFVLSMTSERSPGEDLILRS